MTLHNDIRENATKTIRIYIYIYIYMHLYTFCYTRYQSTIYGKCSTPPVWELTAFWFMTRVLIHCFAGNRRRLFIFPLQDRLQGFERHSYYSLHLAVDWWLSCVAHLNMKAKWASGLQPICFYIIRIQLSSFHMIVSLVMLAFPSAIVWFINCFYLDECVTWGTLLLAWINFNPCMDK